MDVDRIAPDVLRLPLAPFDGLNVYLIGDILVDAGGRFAARRLLGALAGSTVRSHALTHAHFDHQGGSHAVCEGLGVPLMCGEGDREAIESGDLSRVLPEGSAWTARLGRWLGGPAHPVSRVLREGDEVGGFTVLETPGHTPGHVAFWRAADRILILGDVLFHRDPVTLRRGLREPFRFATVDPALNRVSARRMAALEPEVVCFGHGEPLRDAEAFARFVADLPGGRPETASRGRRGDEIEIRGLRAGEEGAVQDLVMRAFDAFVGQEYTPGGVAVFSDYVRPAAILERSRAGHVTLVAAREGRLAGVLELRAAEHVSLLFVDPADHRRGIARRLLEAGLGRLREDNPDLAALTVNSSRYAVPVYERLGFRVEGAERSECGMTFVPMALPLTGPGVHAPGTGDVGR